MICRRKSIRNALPEYGTGRLSPRTELLIREHLDVCSLCSRELRVIASLRREAVPEPAPEFWTSLPGSVTRAIEGTQKRVFPFRRHVWAAGLAAALLLIAWMAGIPRERGAEVVLPAAYDLRAADRSGLGLEADILAISGLPASELGRFLEDKIGPPSRLPGFDPLEDLFTQDLYRVMDGPTMRAFESLIDRTFPVSS